MQNNSTKLRVPDLPSTVYLVVLENYANLLDKYNKRIYLKPQFVKQFIGSRNAVKHRIHVFVRDSERGDIDWREITEEFL